MDLCWSDQEGMGKIWDPTTIKKVVLTTKAFRKTTSVSASWVGVQVYRDLGKIHNTSGLKRMLRVGLKRLLGAGLGLTVVGSYCYANTVHVPPILSGLVEKRVYFHIIFLLMQAQITSFEHF